MGEKRARPWPSGVATIASLPLSEIDTRQPTRSIFDVGVAGTLVGQTRIRGVGIAGRGLLGAYFDLHGDHSSAANLHLQGASEQVDVSRLP